MRINDNSVIVKCMLKEGVMGSAQVPSGGESVFNRVRMGYVVIQSQKIDEWRALLKDGLGMHVASTQGSLQVRLDQQQCRFLIEPGNQEDVVSLGMELTDEEALQIVLQRLRRQRTDVTEQRGPMAALRGVERFWRFKGPKGLNVEVYCRPLVGTVPLQMLSSGYFTGEHGFGHVAIVTRRPQEMFAFWRDIFDIRHTDDVYARISGVLLNFEFLRFNKRHHSIALAYTPGHLKLDPIRTRVQHLEVQVATLDDMTAAYERCKKLGATIAMAVGQHANDRAISFYVKTPSGFEIECGWNPIPVVEESWKGDVWDRISIWGHKPDGVTWADRLGQLGRGLASLVKSEYLPAKAST